MRRQVQFACYLIAAISFLGGLSDVIVQYLNEAEEIRWRIPIILIGIGLGLPIIMFPFHLPAQEIEEEEYDENDLSGVYQDDKSFLMSESTNQDSSNYTNERDSGDTADSN